MTEFTADGIDRTTTLKVSGLTCGHCVAHVTEELEALDGVKDVSVLLNKGGQSTVTVLSDIHLDDAALAATAALVLLSPYTPMLFMGEEWGTRTPFQFFTDHEEEDLARSVSQGRAREFAGFGWDADEIPDPQDAATVETSRLDWSELDKTDHARMLAWYRALTALRRELAWSQRTAWPQIDEADDVVTVTYEDIVVVTHLSGRPRAVPKLSEVLLSWDPVGSAPSCLPPGQTLIARR